MSKRGRCEPPLAASRCFAPAEDPHRPKPDGAHAEHSGDHRAGRAVLVAAGEVCAVAVLIDAVIEDILGAWVAGRVSVVAASTLRGVAVAVAREDRPIAVAVGVSVEVLEHRDGIDSAFVDLAVAVLVGSVAALCGAGDVWF